MKIRKRAHALILEKGIEVVSAQDPFEYGFAALRAAKGTKAILHVQVHTDFLSPWFIRAGNLHAPKVRMPILNKIRVKLADRVLPKVAGIRVVSKRIADSLVARYGARIPVPSIIPIQVPAEAAETLPLSEHPFQFSLIALSRLEPEKRIEDILHALARLALQYPGLGLFIVGEGRERKKLEKIAKMLGLADRVRFLGWRTDARGLLGSAQAFIQASAYEGYGMSLIEAALARVPIITTDVGIVGEVFKGYEDVLSAPPGDPSALATHIRGLIEDPRARQLLVMNAERAARAHLASATDQPARIAADLKAALGRAALTP